MISSSGISSVNFNIWVCHVCGMPWVPEAYSQGQAFDETVCKKKRQHLWPNVKLFARINSAMQAFLKAIKEIAAFIKEKRLRHFSYFRIRVSKTSFWKFVQTQGHISCVLGLWVTSEKHVRRRACSKSLRRLFSYRTFTFTAVLKASKSVRRLFSCRTFTFKAVRKTSAILRLNVF